MGIFLFTTGSRTALGPNQPHLQWVPGALYLGVKRPGREADHSPPSSTEVKERVELYLHPQYASMAWCLVKHRNKFTFTFNCETEQQFRNRKPGVIQHKISLFTAYHGACLFKKFVIFEVEIPILNFKFCDSSVGIATRLWAGRSRFYGSIPGGAGNFSLHHRVQNGFGAHPASYAMGTKGSFPGGKAAGA
jgi:hypothetical protein